MPQTLKTVTDLLRYYKSDKGVFLAEGTDSKIFELPKELQKGLKGIFLAKIDKTGLDEFHLYNSVHLFTKQNTLKTDYKIDFAIPLLSLSVEVDGRIRDFFSIISKIEGNHLEAKLKEFFTDEFSKTFSTKPAKEQGYNRYIDYLDKHFDDDKLKDFIKNLLHPEMEVNHYPLELNKNNIFIKNDGNLSLVDLPHNLNNEDKLSFKKSITSLLTSAFTCEKSQFLPDNYQNQFLNSSFNKRLLTISEEVRLNSDNRDTTEVRPIPSRIITMGNEPIATISNHLRSL